MDTKQQVDIKENILNSALELFAQKGYKNTTVRNICKKAGTYQLSINYHFESKENLYKEVLIRAYEYTTEKELQYKNAHLSAEKQLYELISLKMKNILLCSQRSLFYKILSWEDHNSPQGLLLEIYDLTVLPNYEYLKDLLKTISGQNDNLVIEYYAFSIISQIKGLANSSLARKRLFGAESLTEDQLEFLIQQMNNIVIAGVKNRLASSQEI